MTRTTQMKPTHLHHRTYVVALILACCIQAINALGELYTVIDRSSGLSSNEIRAITQLPDGRMAFVTPTHLCIYDGADFTNITALPSGATLPLPRYTGHHHLYTDSLGHLWIKAFGKVACIDLHTGLHLPTEEIAKATGNGTTPDDLFVDNNGNIWTVTGQSLTSPLSPQPIKLHDDDGTLQDLQTHGNTLFLFFSTGRVAAYDAQTLERTYHRDAYPDEERSRYDATSLVVPGPGGFYQLRNGEKGIFLRFDPEKREWTRMMTTDYTLNTLAITHDRRGLVTCGKGAWEFTLPSGEGIHYSTLLTDHGSLLTTTISTVFEDRDNGLWLGTFNRGLLYRSPGSHIRLLTKLPSRPQTPRRATALFSEDADGNVFLSDRASILRLNRDGHSSPSSDDTEWNTFYDSSNTFVASDGSVYLLNGDSVTTHLRNPATTNAATRPPILTSVRVHGVDIYPDTPLLTSSLQEITLPHNRNFINLEYSLLDYSHSEATSVRYRLSGIDREWAMPLPSSLRNGKLSVNYTNLPPGRYTLTVESSSDSFSTSASSLPLDITIKAPWWLTTAAMATYAASGILLALLAFAAYTRSIKNKMRRRHREEILIMRVKNMISQCRACPIRTAHTTGGEIPQPPTATAAAPSDPADNAFLTRAIATVERNMNVQGYSVEQLSRDLCMDRTGLYRKLTAILDQSPSLFMRSIRLRHAAALLAEDNGMPIGEIAEQTGFSSSSHFSRCFQEAYGCKPSEYARSQQKSTQMKQ